MKRHIGVRGFLSMVLIMMAVMVAEPGWSMDDADFTFGKVEEISQDHVTISEFDPEQDMDVNVVYDLARDVILDNIQSLDEILVGDLIDIEYEESNGKKIAKVIAKDEEIYEMPEYDEGSESLENSKEGMEE
ncbi:MAG: hypothetical protein KC618_01475 [Candidatus Omnitrophica bacterium]|nr:hypothetical protein [Candidatus Omnitrophota bacterium]